MHAFFSVESDKFRCSGSSRREQNEKERKKNGQMYVQRVERWMHHQRRQRHVFQATYHRNNVNYDECMKSGQRMDKWKMQKRQREREEKKKRAQNLVNGWRTQEVHFQIINLPYLFAVAESTNFNIRFEVVLCTFMADIYHLHCANQPKMVFFFRTVLTLYVM